MLHEMAVLEGEETIPALRPVKEDSAEAEDLPLSVVEPVVEVAVATLVAVETLAAILVDVMVVVEEVAPTTAVQIKMPQTELMATMERL